MSTHRYTASIRWASEPDAPAGRYTRVHTVRFDGGMTLRASASPQVVPLPLSAEDAVDPEEAFVFAIASCHMLTVLWDASRAGYQAATYEDSAVGIMATDPDGGMSIHEVTLQPRITWRGTAPTTAVLDHLHHQAHASCFIARSVRCRIHVVSSSC